MKKVTKQPFLRAIQSLFHGRFQRRNVFRINTLELEKRETAVRGERELRTANPKAFAKTGFYNGPFATR